MAGQGSVMKELFGLLRRENKLFEGQVEIVIDDIENQKESEDNEEDVIRFLMNITPNDGLYKGARCQFEVVIDTQEYPNSPPLVRCLNKIYHPNIDYVGGGAADICVNMLADDWQPEVGLDGCVMVVLFLFYNPQIDDALSPVCCSFDNWEEFADNVPKTLRGEEIDGYEFDRLIDVEEEVADGVVNEGDDENVPEAPVVVYNDDRESCLSTDDNRSVLEVATVTNVVDNENVNVVNEAETVLVDDDKNVLVSEATVFENAENEEVLALPTDNDNINDLDVATNVSTEGDTEILVVNDEHNATLVNAKVEVKEKLDMVEVSRNESGQEDAMEENTKANNGFGNLTEVMCTASSGSRQENRQTDSCGDISRTSNGPLNAFMKNCSSFKIWYMKFKEQCALFPNKLNNRS